MFSDSYVAHILYFGYLPMVNQGVLSKPISKAPQFESFDPDKEYDANTTNSTGVDGLGSDDERSSGSIWLDQSSPRSLPLPGGVLPGFPAPEQSSPEPSVPGKHPPGSSPITERSSSGQSVERSASGLSAQSRAEGTVARRSETGPSMSDGSSSGLSLGTTPSLAPSMPLLSPRELPRDVPDGQEELGGGTPMELPMPPIGFPSAGIKVPFVPLGAVAYVAMRQLRNVSQSQFIPTWMGSDVNVSIVFTVVVPEHVEVALHLAC